MTLMARAERSLRAQSGISTRSQPLPELSAVSGAVDPALPAQAPRGRTPL